MGRARVPLIFLAVWLVGFVAVVGASWQLAGGLVFTLDDPYIHLALAENLARGVYGVNLHEPSAPSSSVLYPLLLAPFELVRAGVAGAFSINALAAALTMLLFARALERDVLGGSGPARDVPWPLLAIAGLAVALATSGYALPMTGMEHTLHVLVACASLLFFARAIDAGPEGRFGDLPLVLLLVATPLVRFEGLASSLAIALALFALGRRRTALVALGGIAASLGAFALAMTALGLPALPSSVLSKSGVLQAATSAPSVLLLTRQFLASAMDALGERQFVLCLGLLALALVQVSGAAERAERRRGLAILAVALMVSGAHALMGRFGWFARYEVYLCAFVVLALLLTLRGPIARWRQAGNLLAPLSVLALVLLLGLTYLGAATYTPRASRGIAEQHLQMHRFATEFWGQPVAVNDLGWVSYRNDRYVLDLWGLGSEEVRRARAAGRLDRALVEELLSEREVALAMVYEAWIGDRLPAGWRRVALLRSEKVSAAEGEVAFYAAPRVLGPELAASLARFGESLPARVELELFEEASKGPERKAEKRERAASAAR